MTIKTIETVGTFPTKFAPHVSKHVTGPANIGPGLFITERLDSTVKLASGTAVVILEPGDIREPVADLLVEIQDELHKRGKMGSADPAPTAG